MIVVGLIRELIPKTKPAIRIDIFFKCAMPKYKRKKPVIKKNATSKSTIISPVRKILEVEIEHRNPVIMLAKIFLTIIKVNNAASTGMQDPKTTCDQRTETGAVPEYSKRV
jgi:hypothetical protein